MKQKQIDQRVKILGGMREFIGRTGRIIDNTETDGRTVMYRVRLDSPVLIEGLGEVQDDLWSGKLLRNITKS
jgi:hypothetical protein